MTKVSKKETGSVKMKVLVTQLSQTLCDPMDCCPPGSSVHEIIQEKILQWVAISFSRVSSLPRDQIYVLSLYIQCLNNALLW